MLGADDIAISTGYEVRRAIATPDGMEALIGRLAKLSGSVQQIEAEVDRAQPDGSEVLHLRASAEEAPVVKLVHSVIADAASRGASDIHFDPYRGDMQCPISRGRRHGRLDDRAEQSGGRTRLARSRSWPSSTSPSAGFRRTAVSRSNVDDRHIDIRVATLPVIRGESVVMRILDKDRVVLDLESLGMRAEDRELVLGAVSQIQGAILATGPTGTGKTTTLYALLRSSTRRTAP